MLTNYSFDAELDCWADREEKNAARQGWRLLGVREAASAHREQLRDRGWDRLAVLGADIAELEDSTDAEDKKLESTRQELLQLVTAAIDWGRSDSAIATRATVTRRAVHELRDTAAEASRSRACPGLPLSAPDTGSSSHPEPRRVRASGRSQHLSGAGEVAGRSARLRPALPH